MADAIQHYGDPASARIAKAASTSTIQTRSDRAIRVFRFFLQAAASRGQAGQRHARKRSI